MSGSLIQHDGSAMCLWDDPPAGRAPILTARRVDHSLTWR
jgi:hypothetical protein